MLEGLVAWVLNNYLGKYVENLNTDQLSVALLSGKVELENLPLKKDALRHLGLPVEVKAGFIGKVQLQVPVRQIRTAPWLIAIERLYVVLAPVDLDECDVEAESLLAHERKVSLLDALEAGWRAEHEALDVGYYAASYSSWLSYGTGLLASIVENLQLKLSDVHVRYEDSLTGARPFVAGLAVGSLEADACDDTWERAGAAHAPAHGCSHKLLELQQLAVYWDPAPGDTALAACSVPELTERMSGACEAPHKYLVSPTSARARVRRELTAQPLRSRTRPRLTAHLSLQTVALALTQRQYSEMVGCSLGLERIARLREFRVLRPAAPVRGHARLWWVYAVRCHAPQHRWLDRRCSYEESAARARAARRYVDTCVFVLQNPAATLPAPAQRDKDDYEWNNDLIVLKALRQVAMRKVGASKPTRPPEQEPAPASGRGMLVHWFPQWWGWYSAAPATDAAPAPAPAPPAPAPLEEEILDVIADSLENDTLLKRDAVFGQFEFELHEGCLELCSEPEGGDTEARGAGVELQFWSVRVRVESRPRAASHLLHVALGSVCLRERITPGTLFPVLVAPHGMVPGVAGGVPGGGEPLFQLTYEKRPFGLNCDYRLWVKSGALEVVYQGAAARWARQFLCGPWGEARPHLAYHQTKARLMTHWEHMVHPHPGDRRSWQIELDISAPQIIFVESLCSRDGSVVVVDFGRLRLANAQPAEVTTTSEAEQEDEETFMTPCSTPPGSLLSPGSPPASAAGALDAARLHARLYDSYRVELSELQVLVGRARDNWRAARARSSSSLHLLDRFSILVRAEVRAVRTQDPQYPAAAMCGSLPALQVHLSEHKARALWAVADNIALWSRDGVAAGAGAERAPLEDEEESSVCSDTERSERSPQGTLVMVQFAIEQMSLEVQSRGRSIAEVQVCGARAALSWRPCDTSLSLSVHSLLLVDALQTYGPDFELLVASHKHVGMDTASGSIRGSEPTSPTSPTSPASPSSPSSPVPTPTPPHALEQALNSLHQTDSRRAAHGESWGAAWGGGWCAGEATWGAPGVIDSEALIAVDVSLVRGEGDSEDLRIANILFNNLDIIANQETIVELIGFTQRVLGSGVQRAEAPAAAGVDTEPDALTPDIAKKEVRTEITFDFHRLGVLLVRAGVLEGQVVANKIATATLSEARIQATLDAEMLSVGGSLGGVQVVSLEPGQLHTRVLSAGDAHDAPHPHHTQHDHHADKALTFHVARTVLPADDTNPAPVVEASVSVSVASVWYTHSGPLVRELRSCLTEFKQYLANLARSIRNAAADMAITLVHPRGDSSYGNPRLSQFAEGVSPRRRTVSVGASLDDPPDLKSDHIVLSVSVELESPVVVLPRAPHSTQALVARLGRMSLSNRPGAPANTLYRVAVRDISLHTVDVGAALRTCALSADTLPRVYDVRVGAPVLHDTALQLQMEGAGDAGDDAWSVRGAVVGGLHVSARREQYEQVLHTVRQLADAHEHTADTVPAAEPQTRSWTEGAVPTLRLDPEVRAAVLAVPPPPATPAATPHTALTVLFELATFTVELRADLGAGERSLAQLAFREFTVRYQRLQPLETTLTVSLHSVSMEDLTQPSDSKHRLLMMSHTPRAPPKAVFVSSSCPDVAACCRSPRRRAASLPAGHARTHNMMARDKRDSKCGVTPPCSPADGGHSDSEGEEESVAGEDDSLVRLSVHMRDPAHPMFHDKYDKVARLTKVDFNCLNLVVSIDSWVAVLDFFGVAGDESPPEQGAGSAPAAAGGEVSAEGAGGGTQTETSIRSLSVVLVSSRGEVCRALVSRVRVVSRARLAGGGREVRGRLGALLLHDLTPHSPLWRDRFRTHGERALTFRYVRLGGAEVEAAGHETSLDVEMGPVTYVHTKRFVQELQAFERDFSLLRRVIRQARLKVSSAGGPEGGARWGPRGSVVRRALRVRCAAPVIVVPVSGRARDALCGELARLTLDTCCKTEQEVRPLLEVRRVQLEGLSLWHARGGHGLRVRRVGPPLLPAPASLALQIEHNLSDDRTVPDVTIQGTLTTLELALDPAQYRLVRGVLAHNLGECVDDLLSAPAHEPTPPHTPSHQVCTTTSLTLELLDVRVRLQPVHGVASLACINFIKSRLLVETYSDLGQDIDLRAQEILVSDTRYSQEPANRRGNVFSHIVQPMPERRHSVQAEVHARKRGDSTAYTILVNNMRLMAILEWWEAANQFLMQPPPPAADADQPNIGECGCACPPASTPGHVELKLNVTDSQLVLVEDASLWDTNAVILKSTTVITYRGGDAHKPVSCELNELEVFSCVLGLEEETALSIVEPASLHVALLAGRVLHVDAGSLDLRLSYHDMRMFAAMLHSLPAQARAALSGQTPAPGPPANSEHMRARRAPRRAMPAPAPAPAPVPPPAPALAAVRLTAECVTLCVIDDCLDSDVPLLEVSLSELLMEQDLRKAEESFQDPVLVSTPCGPPPAGVMGAGGAGAGRLGGVLSVDYYNRTLSGWEPAVEPWRFEAGWESTPGASLGPSRLQLDVSSHEVLNANVTSALMDLCRLVRTNWTADYYAPHTQGSNPQSPKGSPAGHRRRSPFVPYALRNHSGHRLWFTTLLTTSPVLAGGAGGAGPDDSWVVVRAGDTEPFSFGARGAVGARRSRRRHPSSHQPAPLHQLALRLDHWDPPDPVCVDRVGVYFRHLTHAKTGVEARIVFEVSLEGSARKLVTVRSALQLVNRLPLPVEVRLEHAPGAGVWPVPAGGGSGAVVCAGGEWAAPLAGGAGALWVRPLPRDEPPPAAARLQYAGAAPLLRAECRAPRGRTYRFCCAVVRERFPPDRGPPVAGHTLTLVPALRLENLLPLELQYRGAPHDAPDGAVAPADTAPFLEVDVESGAEVSVKLEGFAWSSPVVVGGAGGAGGGGGGAGGGGSFTARLKLRDLRGRRLYLNARVTVRRNDGIKVSVSSAYWLVNRTGLPLVFRAEGSAAEAAGQFDEHEVARMVAPLMFSFAEPEAGPTLVARVGSSLQTEGVAAQWCSPFGLGPGVSVKRLSGGERVYAVGVWSRAGRARYRHTNIVTLAPRYQIHNNTRRRMQFAQRCSATTLNDPGAVATHVSAVSGCYLPWHWARWEREHLVCVRELTEDGTPRTAWSGGFRIEAPRTLHVACRELGAAAYVLVRVEVVQSGCTLFVVLSDAESAPAPLRIDNYSPVALMFHQVGSAEECVVGAHASLRWALPEPEGKAALALRAPGGPSTTVHLDALPAQHQLLYQNFIYVVFTHTQERGEAVGEGVAREDGGLVLEVPLNSTRVVLGRKRHGDRSQLWRRGPGDQLIHEGSSPPQPTDALLAEEAPLSPHAMVLDIEDAAPRPGRASALVLRRADARRASTQAWRVVPPGRMACAHANLCVQPDGGLMALTPGSRVVLGLAAGRSGRELGVSWRTLRPGSGRLELRLAADGPTRLLAVHDREARDAGRLEGATPEDAGSGWWGGGREWEVRVWWAALSVSLVARAPPAELVHARFSGLALEAACGARSARLALAVAHMQWDNQLLDTPGPVLLYVLPARAPTPTPPPALHAAVELMRAPARRYEAYFFRHLVVALQPLGVRLEERLMLRLCEWSGAGDDESAREAPDEAEYEARRVLAELTALHATRCYFGLVKLIPSQIRLSMLTASKLEGGLAALKRRLGLTLIRFEDACVELEPFVRAHPFDTPHALARHALAHFKEELKWQAAKILGSVDFLGNPLGFVSDVSEGVSGLLLEGNVAALLQNVTHGISNSAAKVTESLGDGLERVVGDEAHEETRRRIRSAAPGAHLAAGFRGLGLGILGGMTSLVKHSYEGATSEGLPGFLAGVGKGLLGTVTKPVIGVLDLAAETASALRDSSRRSDKWVPERVRAPRCASGPRGLLPRYCGEQARGAALLHALAGGRGETFLAYRTVRDTPHDIRALLSDTYLRIFTCKHAQPQVVMETHLSNLVSCAAVCAGGAHYVELGVRGGGAGGAGAGEAVRRPRVQCDSAELAEWVARHAAYARQLHHERTHTLLTHADT